MLSKLTIQNTGPMQAMSMSLASRLNALTGDNSLGKSFLLDVMWWALSDSWAGEPASPFRPLKGPPPSVVKMAYELRHRQGSFKDMALQRWDTFQSGTQTWKRENWDLVPDDAGPIPQVTPYNEPIYRPTILGVYATVDGGFAIYDSYRVGPAGAEPIFLTQKQVFGGKKQDITSGPKASDEGDICNGLIRDLVDWKSRQPEVFTQFVAGLDKLSKHAQEPITVGEPARLRPTVSTWIPTLNLPYGNVPVTLASAGMRRVLALNYVLVWAWYEHVRNAELVGQVPVRDMVVLIDEVEAHLHPQWQRALVPAMLEVIGAMAPEVEVQACIATHSPLVLASMEPQFDEMQDALWKLDLVDGVVKIAQDVWRKRGDASRWLRSDVFDMKMATSKELEDAMGRAGDLMRQTAPAVAQVQAMDVELQKLMAAMDPMYLNWRRHMERWLPVEAE